MNSRPECYTIPPRPRRLRVCFTPPTDAPPRRASSDGDDLRRLALEVVQHDPVLAHLLARAGARRTRQD